MDSQLSFAIRPKLQILSDQEAESFYFGALDVLERIGVKVLHPEAIELLQEAGGFVGDEGVVRLRPPVVEEALASTPKRLVIYDRLGRPAMTLGGGNTGGLNTYYGTGSDLKRTYDPLSGQLRLTVAQDIANMARVVDYLPDMDFLMSYGIPSDADMERVYRTEFMEMVCNSTKPIVFTSDNGPDSRRIIDMAAVVAGGLEELRQKPFVLSYAQPTSPLQHSFDALGKVLTCAEADIPVCYPPGMMPGATSPCTMAGTIIQSLAEALSVMVIHQAKRPGAPLVLCGAHGCFDMKTSINAYAAPERLMTEAALATVYQSFGLPTWGFGGCSDAQILDEQAGAEFGLMAMWAALTGVNLAHDTGYLGSGMIGDLKAIVLNNEINSYVRHLLVRGVPVDDETRAMEAMERVGHGGQYLADKHTFAHFKTELWLPELSNRLNLSAWTEAGRKTMRVRLGEKVKEILESHRPQPLAEETVAELDKMRLA
ncbi:MAG: trimethylamine methyltransferase family protein [Deltaproteobacteria bacterium]|nr:trimethylamine methyltransferase family protein [Deltaproteobacteria bacterium]